MRLTLVFNICCLALAQGCIPLAPPAPTCERLPVPPPPGEVACKCGIKNANTAKDTSKVVGGQNAAKGEFPWQVGLVK